MSRPPALPRQEGHEHPGSQFETSGPTTRKVDGVGYFSTTCPSPDIDEGVKNAVHDMLELLEREHWGQLARPCQATLGSLAGG
jgi:hypothetical protein